MGRLHLVFISPKREPGTPEHEITDQEHSPLFPTRKTNDVNVSERRASPLRIACDVMEIQKIVPLLLSSLSSLAVDFGDAGASSTNEQKERERDTHLLQIRTV